MWHGDNGEQETTGKVRHVHQETCPSGARGLQLTAKSHLPSPITAKSHFLCVPQECLLMFFK